MTAINEALNSVWETVPKADRYSISGKRFVMVWGPNGGALMPLAEYAETKQTTMEKKDDAGR